MISELSPITKRCTSSLMIAEVESLQFSRVTLKNILPFSGTVSKTEFFGHLLTSDEFGCVDDWVCLISQVQEASEKVASEFQELYGKLFRVQFVHKEKPKSVSPAPVTAVSNVRRDSIPERKDPDRERRDSIRDSNRERRDSLRESRNSSSHSDKNAIVRIANDGDSHSSVSTPEPTKVQTNGSNQMQPEQLVSTDQFLESEFQTSKKAPVYNPQSMPDLPEIKLQKRNSVDRDTIPVSNDKVVS
jgi:hypothetical protein